MATFLNLLIDQIHESGDGWWVTLSSDQHNISGKKTFTGDVKFGKNTTISNDGTISSSKIIEGTARKAYWA